MVAAGEVCVLRFSSTERLFCYEQLFYEMLFVLTILLEIHRIILDFFLFFFFTKLFYAPMKKYTSVNTVLFNVSFGPPTKIT